jgi:hypothetical protein
MHPEHEKPAQNLRLAVATIVMPPLDPANSETRDPRSQRDLLRRRKAAASQIV